MSLVAFGKVKKTVFKALERMDYFEMWFFCFG
jgi:hypothetical protein